MTGIYGDLLTHFVEQFREVSYFYMKPNTTSGFTNKTDLGKVRGVFQFVKQSELKQQDETLSDVAVPTFWTRGSLSFGNYFISFDDQTYRIKNRNKWNFEAGFNCYILELVTNWSAKSEPHEDVRTGADDYE